MKKESSTTQKEMGGRKEKGEGKGLVGGRGRVEGGEGEEGYGSSCFGREGATTKKEEGGREQHHSKGGGQVSTTHKGSVFHCSSGVVLVSPCLLGAAAFSPSFVGVVLHFASSCRGGATVPPGCLGWWWWFPPPPLEWWCFLPSSCWVVAAFLPVFCGWWWCFLLLSLWVVVTICFWVVRRRKGQYEMLNWIRLSNKVAKKLNSIPFRKGRSITHTHQEMPPS